MSLINWDEVKTQYDAITSQLASPDLDSRERAQLAKKASQYSSAISKHDEIEKLKKEIGSLRADAQKDQELAPLYEQEASDQTSKLEQLESELEELLYPADEKDDSSVFLEIRAGTGGQEAALFASDLYKMYSNYALSQGWQVSIVDFSSTDLGGFKELIAYIKGKGVYKLLKHESGVHRVQRVPATETQGRVHTSTVTVAVLPEVEEVDVKINLQELRIDVYRSSGAGGQHVNTTDSAVRITHLPTGLVVTCQDERSQGKNKAKAMKVLQSRLFELERKKREAELSAKRKQQIGTGERAEKIRTYNFPQNRVTDHRVELTLKKLDLVMQGDLKDLLLPLVDWERAQRRQVGSFLLQ